MLPPPAPSIHLYLTLKLILLNLQPWTSLSLSKVFPWLTIMTPELQVPFWLYCSFGKISSDSRWYFHTILLSVETTKNILLLLSPFGLSTLRLVIEKNVSWKGAKIVAITSIPQSVIITTEKYTHAA